MDSPFGPKCALQSPRRHLRPCRLSYTATAAVFMLSLLGFLGVKDVLEAGGLVGRCLGDCSSAHRVEDPGKWLALGAVDGRRALDQVANKWKDGIGFGAGIVDQFVKGSRWQSGEPGQRPHPSCAPEDLVYMYELPAEGLYNVGFFDTQGCWKFYGHHPRNACSIYDPDLDGLGPRYRGAQQARLEELGTPPEAWTDTGQFALEVIFHRWLERRYPCRTWDPERAAGFYVPFYSGIAHMYNYELRGCNQRPFCEDPPDGPPCDCKNSDYPGIPRLATGDLLTELKRQPYLERNGGRDHFIVISRVMYDVVQAWGCCSSGLLTLPETRQFVKLGIEIEPAIERALQMGIPYPTCFHPRHQADVTAHRKAILGSRRQTLVSFVGTFARPGLVMGAELRRTLEAQCERHPAACSHLECDMECECPDVLAHQMNSTFCLQPAGDTPTRRSFFDSLQAGCIPVLFQRESAYDMYPRFLPPEESSYSVYIPSDDFLKGDVDIVEMLRGIPLEKVAQMRGVIADMLENTTYFAEEPAAESGIAKGGQKDAFYIALSAALARIREGLSKDLDRVA